MYSQVTQCRSCQSSKLVPLLSLGSQALTGIFPKDESDQVPAGPLDLIKCQSCDLVQLGHSFELSQLYGQNYGYRSGLNGSMVRHLNAKIQKLVSMVDLCEGDLVLDIGSNDGTTLRAYPNRNLDLVGMDPTGAKFRAYYPSDVHLIPDFFSGKTFKAHYGTRKAKIVTSIAMFYDLEDPVSFMKDVESILDEDGVWAFEQSYLGSMLDANSYDTICHEHLEYYGLKQIQTMAEQCGLKILDVEMNDVNGGSFAVLAAKKTSRRPAYQQRIDEILNNEERVGLYSVATFKSFESRIQEHKKEVIRFLDWAKGNGKRVIGYGASTKGNVLLQYCGITASQLPCIAEVNEDKFGAFTPGTMIPIVSETAAHRMEPDFFFVLPWHFKAGILHKERSFQQKGGKIVFPLPDFLISPPEDRFAVR